MYEGSKLHARANGYSYSDFRDRSGNYCSECRVCEAYESGAKDATGDLEEIKADVTHRLSTELHEENFHLKERVAALEEQLSQLETTVPQPEASVVPDQVTDELVEQLRAANLYLSHQVATLTTQIGELSLTRKTLLHLKDATIADLTYQLNHVRSVMSLNSYL